MSLFSLYFPPLPPSMVALRDTSPRQLHHNHINNLSTHMQMHHPYLFIYLFWNENGWAFLCRERWFIQKARRELKRFTLNVAMTVDNILGSHVWCTIYLFLHVWSRITYNLMWKKIKWKWAGHGSQRQEVLKSEPGLSNTVPQTQINQNSKQANKNNRGIRSVGKLMMESGGHVCNSLRCHCFEWQLPS